MAGLIRLLFILDSHLPFESDEAIVGLMARHILYQGERPVFYYGQGYLGPLEPASAALSFWLFGPSVTALRLAPAIYSVVFVYFTARFALRAFGAPAAVASLVYLSLPPLFLLTWSVKARGGYAELIALGAVFLVLVVDLGQEQPTRMWKWLALGAIGGLAAWTDPLAVVYLVPGGLYLALAQKARLVHWHLLGAFAAFVAVSWPMLIANVHSRGATLEQLTGPNVSQSVSLAAYRHNLAAVVRDSLPTLLGFFEGSSNLAAFSTAKADGPWPLAVATVLALTLAVGAVLMALISAGNALRGRPTPRDLLVWVGACTILLFCASQSEVLYITEPRYLLPLFALVPIGGAIWSRLWSIRGGVAVIALAAVVGFNAFSILSFAPALAAPRLANQVVDAGNPDLARFLDGRQIHAIYGDYWLVYPVAFQSGERIIPSVIDDNLHVGFNRYVPYAISADQNEDVAVVVVDGSPAAARLDAYLVSSGRDYRVEHWHNLEVFEQIRPQFRPLRV
ncbi:MAG TPA: glycosyltransferase family 39 protein [Chloroflexota bacterium]|nr:glycosyltransferase family 39 protein [Chloroflexota bacterium]